MEKHGADREKILRLLEHEGGVTEDSVQRVARSTGIAEAEVWGAGLFYGLIRSTEPCVRVCDGLSCQLAGADALADRQRASGETVERVSCLARCDRAPAALDPSLEVLESSARPCGLTPDDPGLPLNLGGADTGLGGALERARSLGPAAVLDMVEASGLQGRGGAGFPAHLKWRSVLSQGETERYVVCNADEGEPGTFKDREVMLRRPGLMLEGLALMAEVIGARDIYIYIRGEFRAERRSVEGTLGGAQDVLSAFDWHLVNGHGAYICGEETALLESLEGKRGMPRLKPPFPTEAGFRGKPTLIHNVETAACVPSILQHGGAWFRDQGRTEAGTKLYCISGHVRRPGVYELPLGITLDELAAEAGGYEGNPLAFSPGGASSGFLPMDRSGVPLDYDHLAREGSMLGSAGVVVLNDTVDLKQVVAWQLRFFERESCGQCAPCRIGTRYLHRQVEAVLGGGPDAHLRHAGDVAWEMEEGSICGLGMTAAKPLESILTHFPGTFEE